MSPQENADFLEHYGKKGMKWGVINEDKSVGGTRAQKKALDEANKIFAHQAEIMRKKYGPAETDKDSSPKDRKLSDEQKAVLKKLAIGVGVVGVVGGAAILGKKVQNFGKEPVMELITAPSSTAWKDKLSDVSIDLPSGSILKRISTEAESTIRPGGFYAAFEDSDVARYKAILPRYWKQWGYTADEGHVVNIVAKNGVKAPSAKQTVELYNEWAQSHPDWVPDSSKHFAYFAENWATRDNDVDSFFKLLVSKGYNAVIDLNDAGRLAKSPLRMLTSDGFEVSSVERLSKEAIQAAQLTAPLLENPYFIHAAMLLGIDFMDTKADALIDNILMHYGKKGMKWGVINEDKLVGKSGSSAQKKAGVINKTKLASEISTQKKAQQKALNEANKIFAQKAETMRKKYGPAETSKDSPHPKDHRLSDEQKAALKKVAIAGAVIGGLYLGNKFANKYVQDFVLKAQLGDAPKPMHAFWNDHLTVPHAVKLDKLSDVSIDLPSGHILRRVSTEAESTIKAGGFYASFEDSDTERYKAVLPIYWKQWGYKASEGHVVNIVAKNGIKAPSPKQTLELFNEFSKSNPAFTANDYNSFYGFAHIWADETNYYTVSFFKLLASKGYNAVVDLNDAGGLAKTPLRMLTGDGFEVSSVEKLTKEAIRAAQEKITILEHAAMLLGIDFAGMAPDELLDNILMHYGKEQNHRKKLSDEDLVKYVERLQKNKKHNALTHKDLEYGRTVTKRILEESGKTIAIGILQQV